MKTASLVMALVFASWAGFQYNDVNAALWMGAYGLAALISLLYALNVFSLIGTWGLCVLYVAGAAVLAVQVVSGRLFIFGEAGREMLGLLVVAGWTGVLAWRARRQRRTA